MKDKKELIKNIVIIILSIVLMVLISIYVIDSIKDTNEKEIISETEYREKLKEELLNK